MLRTFCFILARLPDARSPWQRCASDWKRRCACFAGRDVSAARSEPRGRLLLDVYANAIPLWTQAMAIRTLQEAIAAHVSVGVSLVDELLQMHGEEAPRLEAVGSALVARVRRGTK